MGGRHIYLLIDGDTPCYAAAAVHEEDDVERACYEVDAILNGYLTNTAATDFKVYITGDNNFRYNIYPEYKANRLKTPKPRHLQAVREHVMRTYNPVVSQGNEADDELAFAQTAETCICTIDKDLNQVPGKHYHPGLLRKNVWIKEPHFYTVTEEEGRHFFYNQLLVGDATDNIKGAVGIGPKKAENILTGCRTEWDYYQACLPFFSCDEELLLNARCLKIGQTESSLWLPPKETE